MNRMISYTSIVLSAMFIFTGCGGYGITYATQPGGAQLICNGEVKGTTPKTLYYELSEQNKAYKQLRTVSCAARWFSGSTKNYSSLWDLNQFPNGVKQTLTSDNYQQDAQYELQLRQTEAAERVARANERAARANESAARAQKQQADQQFYNSLMPKTYNVQPNYSGGYTIRQY